MFLLTLKIVVWLRIYVQLGNYYESKYGDTVLPRKMRGTARIAWRCHSVTQIGQPRTLTRLWAVEAEPARLADIFSLLLMLDQETWAPHRR